MARGDAGEHRTWQRQLTPDRLASRNDRERSGCGDREGVHSLANNVLTQNRAERSPAIAVAGERSGAGAFELDVTTHPIKTDDLTKKQGAAVTQLGHEGAKLVPGIGHRQRFGEFWYSVASK